MIAAATSAAALSSAFLSRFLSGGFGGRRRANFIGLGGVLSGGLGFFEPRLHGGGQRRRLGGFGQLVGRFLVGGCSVLRLVFGLSGGLLLVFLRFGDLLLGFFEILKLLGQFGGALVGRLLIAGLLESVFDLGQIAERLGLLIEGFGLLGVEQIAGGFVSGGLGLLELGLCDGELFQGRVQLRQVLANLGLLIDQFVGGRVLQIGLLGFLAKLGLPLFQLADEGQGLFIRRTDQALQPFELVEQGLERVDDGELAFGRFGISR